MKVFVTREIPEIGIKMMREAGLEVTQWLEKRDLTQKELIAYCLNHDALLSSGANKIDKIFLHKCSHLKVIALLSVGYDNVDIEEAKKLAIPIGNTPGVLSGATADTAFLLMLATSRKAFYNHKKIIKGEWEFFDPIVNLGIELSNKTIGIFGLGKIGYVMAKRCVGAYDMRVIYHNRSHNKEAEQKLGAKKVSFEQLLEQSDVLSVHTALTDATKGIFNKDAFTKMKPGSIFINTARGAIHNEKDLIQALENKTIWGAGLDVTNPEPMLPDNPLLNMPNVCVLPHIGSATIEARTAMAKLAAANIIAGVRGEKLPNPVETR
ncbi:2-hydroxyacid dehydrogenase [Pinibacter soli]|uniref:D-glycerate dehydrogenase n=1 Tax=Pinibacter soli TaxID=3044211 RepID=A0ABT6RI18_9BACT|nr:D-glycerate dehydrogenase [Pinibacter soli]MDI3322195.1 D-glycerate dehydrogenase [Pinibacter soli]